MILLTGAGGKTGQAILRALATRGGDVRALVRRPEQVQQAIDLGAGETAVGNLLNADDIARAMDGVRSVYLIAPNMHPREVAICELALAAARAAGVERVVYHSVLHPQTREMPHHWQKLEVEEAIVASGLTFTILQPAAYMQNIAAYWDEIVGGGSYAVPYGEGGALSLVDLEDVAEAAAIVLTGAGHGDATYELAGPEALLPSTIASVISSHLGRTIGAATIPIPAWAERARSQGVDDYSIATLSKMFQYYDQHGLRGNPRVLASLLGRPPRDLANYVGRLATT